MVPYFNFDGAWALYSCSCQTAIISFSNICSIPILVSSRVLRPNSMFSMSISCKALQMIEVWIAGHLWSNIFCEYLEPWGRIILEVKDSHCESQALHSIVSEQKAGQRGTHFLRAENPLMRRIVLVEGLAIASGSRSVNPEAFALFSLNKTCATCLMQ